MAIKKVQLKNGNGDILYPKTRTADVYVGDVDNIQASRIEGVEMTVAQENKAINGSNAVIAKTGWMISNPVTLKPGETISAYINNTIEYVFFKVTGEDTYAHVGTHTAGTNTKTYTNDTTASMSIVAVRNGIGAFWANITRIRLKALDLKYEQDYNLFNAAEVGYSLRSSDSTNTAVGRTAFAIKDTDAEFRSLYVRLKAGDTLTVRTLGYGTVPGLMVLDGTTVLFVYNSLVNNASNNFNGTYTASADCTAILNWKNGTSAYYCYLTRGNEQISVDAFKKDIGENLFDNPLEGSIDLYVSGSTPAVGDTITRDTLTRGTGLTHVKVWMNTGDKAYVQCGSAGTKFPLIVLSPDGEILSGTRRNTAPSMLSYGATFTAAQNCWVIANNSSSGSGGFKKPEFRLYRSNADNTPYSTVNGQRTGSDTVALNGGYISLRNEIKAFKYSNTSNKTYEEPSLVPGPTLCLIHFSDIHGNTSNFQTDTLKRMIRFKNVFGNYIDDIISTGDNVSGLYSEGYDFWTNAGAGGILTAIGNHDGSRGANDDRGEPKTNVYARYIGQFAEGWGITQPTGAETNGYCFYYKDYSNAHVRLIVLDDFCPDTAYETAQNQWFAAVLADALNNNLHVLIAKHVGVRSGSVRVDCGFDNFLQLTSSDYGVPPSTIAILDQFITDGGSLIAVIGGHYHVDMMRVLTMQDSGNKMPFIAISSAQSYWQQGCDHFKTANDKSQDLFNLMFIDTTRKLLKIKRIGADISVSGQMQKSVVFKYDTCELKCEN